MKSDLQLYLEAYQQCLEAGDDEMNAKCRIIEMGASPEMADAVEHLESLGKEDDDF
jgi:hypothetical protein